MLTETIPKLAIIWVSNCKRNITNLWVDKTFKNTYIIHVNQIT